MISNVQMYACLFLVMMSGLYYDDDAQSTIHDCKYLSVFFW